LWNRVVSRNSINIWLFLDNIMAVDDICHKPNINHNPIKKFKNSCRLTFFVIIFFVLELDGRGGRRRSEHHSSPSAKCSP
jgi:hypothetical protein